jgi:hypothetical protein
VSALWAPISNWRSETRDDPGPRAKLRAVAPPAARLSRVPFLLVLIAIFGIGMAGLLMLNTTLQNQAFQSRALDRQATELAYAQADLENQLDALGAPQELARRASAMGMRPNPYPALLVLPKGTVIGKPQPVTGAEVPSLVVKTPAEIAADEAAAKAKAAQLAADKLAAEKKAAEDAKRKAAEQAAAAKQKVADEKAAAKQKAADQQAAAKKAAAKKTSGKTSSGNKKGNR